MLRAAVLLLLFLCSAAVLAQPLQPWRGGAAPALELRDLEGATHRLQDYGGKVVLVNFWATWCGPCRAEMPSLERLRAHMAEWPFVILAVNVGESERTAREYAAGLPVRFTVLLDRDTRTMRAWSARVLPATFIIGQDGRIRYRHLGELDWSSAAVRAQIEALFEPGGTRASR